MTLFMRPLSACSPTPWGLLLFPGCFFTVLAWFGNRVVLAEQMNWEECPVCDDQFYVSAWLGCGPSLFHQTLGVAVKVFCRSD